MRIAVFLPNWVGDAVMATPALRALREHLPGARIIGVLKPYVAGVLEGSPWFDEQIILDKRGPWRQRWPAAAWRLRRESVELALLFPNTLRTALAAWLGGCRRRVGYVGHGRGWLLTDPLDPVRDAHGRSTPRPIIDAYNLLVEHVGGPAPGRRMELFTMPRDEAAADEVWETHGLGRHSEVVCLNPGAAFGSAKHWPTDYFVELARDLHDRRGSGVLVLCGPAERALAEEITVRAARPGVHALAGRPLSLGLTKACIRRAGMLITTDSGPRHFAAAFGRPVVTLFGPTHIAWTETYYPLGVHLQKEVECGPCQRRVCPLDHRCMKLLGPAEVFASAADLLQRFSPARTSA